MTGALLDNGLYIPGGMRHLGVLGITAYQSTTTAPGIVARIVAARPPERQRHRLGLTARHKVTGAIFGDHFMRHTLALLGNATDWQLTAVC